MLFDRHRARDLALPQYREALASHRRGARWAGVVYPGYNTHPDIMAWCIRDGQSGSMVGTYLEQAGLEWVTVKPRYNPKYDKEVNERHS